MKRDLRIEGIYDSDTYKFLSKLNVENFVFDFRPKSLNFLQHRVLIDILKNSNNSSHKYYLKFENSPGFVIRKFLEDLKELYVNEKRHFLFEKHLNLEFCGNEDASFLNSFQFPFVWHFKKCDQWKDVISSNYLRGIVFSYKILNEWQIGGKFEAIMTEILPTLLPLVESKNIKIILSLDWKTSIHRSIKNYLEIDTFSFPINDKVEKFYRHVDTTHLENNLLKIKAFHL